MDGAGGAPSQHLAELCPNFQINPAVGRLLVDKLEMEALDDRHQHLTAKLKQPEDYQSASAYVANASGRRISLALARPRDTGAKRLRRLCRVRRRSSRRNAAGPHTPAPLVAIRWAHSQGPERDRGASPRQRSRGSAQRRVHPRGQRRKVPANAALRHTAAAR